MDVENGTIYGRTDASNAFWQTLLAGSKNVFNLGGNIETTNLDAPPFLITIDDLPCFLKEVPALPQRKHFKDGQGQIICHRQFIVSLCGSTNGTRKAGQAFHRQLRL